MALSLAQALAQRPIQTPREFASLALSLQGQPDQLGRLQVALSEAHLDDLALALDDLRQGRRSFTPEALEQIATRNFPGLQATLTRFAAPERVVARLTETLAGHAVDSVFVYEPTLPPQEPIFGRELAQGVLADIVNHATAGKSSPLIKAVKIIELGPYSGILPLLALRLIAENYSKADWGTFVRILERLATLVDGQAESRVKDMARAVLSRIHNYPPQILQERADLREKFKLYLERPYPSWSHSNVDRFRDWVPASLLPHEGVSWNSPYPPWQFAIPSLIGMDGSAPNLLPRTREFFSDVGTILWKRTLALDYYSLLVHLHRLDNFPFINLEEADATLKALSKIFGVEATEEGDRLFIKMAKALYAEMVIDQIRFPILIKKTAGEALRSLTWAKDQLRFLEEDFSETDPVVQELAKSIESIERNWKDQVAWPRRAGGWVGNLLLGP